MSFISDDVVGNSFEERAKRALFKATLWGTLTAFSLSSFPGIYSSKKAYAQSNESKIAFRSNRDGNHEIYVMDSDGSNQKNLTNNPAWDLYPSWSPDGRKIAFVSDRDGNDEIYVMDSDGSNQKRLANNPADDYDPSWSPDGRKIAFVSDRDGNDEIYVMDSDGSNQKNLTNNPTDDNNPSWSPDGTKIAFVSDVSDRDEKDEIYLMDSDGSNQKRLTNNSGYNWHPPSWSPDGTKIAFALDSGEGWGIYLMDSDGSNQKRLTNNSKYDQCPCWSPDGTKIAFVSARDGNYEIYVMDSDGSNQKRLTNNPAWDWSPSWSKGSVVPLPPLNESRAKGNLAVVLFEQTLDLKQFDKLGHPSGSKLRISVIVSTKRQIQSGKSSTIRIVVAVPNYDEYAATRSTYLKSVDLNLRYTDDSVAVTAPPRQWGYTIVKKENRGEHALRDTTPKHKRNVAIAEALFSTVADKWLMGTISISKAGGEIVRTVRETEDMPDPSQLLELENRFDFISVPQYMVYDADNILRDTMFTRRVYDIPVTVSGESDWEIVIAFKHLAVAPIASPDQGHVLAPEDRQLLVIKLGAGEY